MKPTTLLTSTPNPHMHRLSAALCSLGLVAFRAYAESLDDLAGIVRVEHTRSFSDVDRLAYTVQTSPTATVQVSSGTAPSELIMRVYGFGASNSRDAYNLMESRILELNRASSPTKLPAGKVFVPDLPMLTSRSVAATDSASPVFRNPSAVVGIDAHGAAKFQGFAYAKPIKIGSPIGQSLTYTRLDRHSASEAARIIAEAAKQNQNVAAGIEAGIQLAANPTDCSEPSAEVLSTAERNAIGAALNGATDQTERYLFVLDTGWPTQEDQVRSMQLLRRILDTTRSAVRLPASALSRFDPAIQPEAFVPMSHAHACMISRAMREFVALDKSGRIKTVFVPLRPGQTASRDLFREIIELDQLIIALGGELFARSPAADEIALAKQFASEALSQLKALKEPWAAGDDVVRVYEPLISGLLRILDAYARINPVVTQGMMPKVDARFWLSLSWNFTKFAAAPSLPTSDNYMVFAAAGNDKQDFVVGHRLFASEATIGKRVFAVMNHDEKLGILTCNSALFATLWDEENSDSNIGSFPGRLGMITSQLCPGPGGGTSFSTPRLAWLTAASDAASRAKDVNWQKTLSVRLLKSREKVEADPNAAPIRVLKLFSSQ